MKVKEYPQDSDTWHEGDDEGIHVPAMSYAQFAKINGSHPYKERVPGAHIDYPVRTRHGGKVFYFNFDLAKEMGLIEKNHSPVLNDELARAILDTFSLEIINEHDVLHKRRIPKKDMRPHQYMATRYLQSQHPDKRGYTSGDGRSIWNGCFKGKKTVWDISSCGTGATRLSPATAIHGEFFKTGDGNISYGSGRADLPDGVCAALMSDIFHKNGIPTERTLAVVAYKDGTSINVRAYRNLIRPAHLFRFVKQADYAGLKAAVDYFVERQEANGDWPALEDEKERYRYFLDRLAGDFARAAARFEREYVFCWLDWDGDNVLMDGAVLDYGSVRQFGLYHHEYRYDDVDRMSTTITEQKNKARYIVQTFAQITDFLFTRRKQAIKQFRGHPALKKFDAVFEQTKDEILLYKMGFDAAARSLLLHDSQGREWVHAFGSICSHFEMVQSKKGLYAINDGITSDAVFCLRDILRELPGRYLQGETRLEPHEFMEIMKSDYASDEDAKLNKGRRAKIAAFQRLYRQLVDKAAKVSGNDSKTILREMTGRSVLINRYERVTGDAIIFAAEKLVSASSRVDSGTLHDMFNDFVSRQVLCPEYFGKESRRVGRVRNKHARKVLDAMLEDVKELRAGI